MKTVSRKTLKPACAVQENTYRVVGKDLRKNTVRLSINAFDIFEAHRKLAFKGIRWESVVLVD